MSTYLIYGSMAALLIATLAILWLLWRMTLLRRKDAAVRRFLDAADGLENDLRDCKARMVELQASIRRLALLDLPKGWEDPVGTVQTALVQVLNQRRWLQESVATATTAEILTRCEGFDRSREKLSTQLAQLEQMRVDLERADATVSSLERDGALPVRELVDHLRRQQ
jgi:hypothetical protein